MYFLKINLFALILDRNKEMKKLTLALLLISSQSLFSQELDMGRTLHCAVDITGYDDVQKFSISGLKKNFRDVEVHSTSSGFYQNACKQTDEILRCNWDKSIISSYSVYLNLAHAEISYDYDNEPESIVINGEIESTFGRVREVRCTQSLVY